MAGFLFGVCSACCGCPGVVRIYFDWGLGLFDFPLVFTTRFYCETCGGGLGGSPGATEEVIQFESTGIIGPPGCATNIPEFSIRRRWTNLSCDSSSVSITVEQEAFGDCNTLTGKLIKEFVFEQLDNCGCPTGNATLVSTTETGDMDEVVTYFGNSGFFSHPSDYEWDLDVYIGPDFEPT